ncbi:MAG: iron-sulfur cluster assembly accessory protein [SAR324 cluster bacterium]|jgi:iron-sulfur cluster assembly accessory protein|nr:iron-sulfur cluster assembly accessory protein [SAR324 cluster bacterium]|tara:strand:- start:96 stop:482 length:387 start_codon:yes stop_codon:yes gene_type:complete
MEKGKELPSVVLTERAAQVFKDSCEAEGLTLQDTFLRIGARPGGCSGWKYELESNSPEDVGPNDIKILSQDVSIIIDREALTDILGAIRIDYSDKNLVEQGFVFEQLINGHQCGCGESFTPVRDLKNG